MYNIDILKSKSRNLNNKITHALYTTIILIVHFFVLQLNWHGSTSGHISQISVCSIECLGLHYGHLYLGHNKQNNSINLNGIILHFITFNFLLFLHISYTLHIAQLFLFLEYLLILEFEMIMKQHVLDLKSNCIMCYQIQLNTLVCFDLLTCCQ